LDGKISITDLAMKFNTDFQTAKEHIDSHDIQGVVRNKFEETEKVLEHGEYVKEFKFMMTILKDKLEQLYAVDDVSPQTLSNLSKLIGEMRKLLMDIAEYDGKVHKGQINVVVEQQQKELDLIMDILLNEICPECRIHVIKRLEEEKIRV